MAARAEQVLAAGSDEQADLAGAAGRVAAAEAELNQRDSLLEAEEQRLESEAKAFRQAAERVDDERSALHPLERGLITAPLESALAGVLGLADVTLFGVFLNQYGPLSQRVAWFSAVFVGIAVAGAGWALGRGVLAPTRTLDDRRLGLGCLIATLVLAAAWFLWGMEETRSSGTSEGELATIAFGAPLCAVALAATAVLAFITGAGLPGRELAARVRSLLKQADERESAAREASERRHALRSALAAATGAQRTASDSKSHRWEAAKHRSEAEREEGHARWGLARLFARLFPPPSGEETRLGADALVPPDQMRRVRYVLIAVSAGLGAGLLALAGELGGLPGAALVALGALGAAAGVALALWISRSEPIGASGLTAGGVFPMRGRNGGGMPPRPNSHPNGVGPVRGAHGLESDVGDDEVAP